MNNDQRYMIAALNDRDLDEDEARFVEFHTLADHQPLTEEQGTRLLDMYEKYISYGRE